MRGLFDLVVSIGLQRLPSWVLVELMMKACNYREILSWGFEEVCMECLGKGWTCEPGCREIDWQASANDHTETVAEGSVRLRTRNVAQRCLGTARSLAYLASDAFTRAASRSRCGGIGHHRKGMKRGKDGAVAPMWLSFRPREGGGGEVVGSRRGRRVVEKGSDRFCRREIRNEEWRENLNSEVSWLQYSIQGQVVEEKLRVGRGREGTESKVSQQKEGIGTQTED